MRSDILFNVTGSRGLYNLQRLLACEREGTLVSVDIFYGIFRVELLIRLHKYERNRAFLAIHAWRWGTHRQMQAVLHSRPRKRSESPALVPCSPRDLIVQRKPFSVGYCPLFFPSSPLYQPSSRTTRQSKLIVTSTHEQYLCQNTETWLVFLRHH